MSSGSTEGFLPVIPPGIALITGPTLLGIMLNWGFMGVLAAQVYFYTTNFPGDSKTIKSLVYGLAFIDVLQTCMMSADAFHWFVFGFGNMDQLNDTFLNSWDVPFLDSIISLVVQLFYCWRIYVLRNRSLLFPVIIGVVSLVQCGAGIATAVVAHRLGKLSLISTEVVEQTIWLVGSVVADILITIVLSWTLLRTRSNELRTSDSVLTRIVRLTVETNSLTSSVAVLSLIFFLAIPQHSTLVVPPTAMIGKLYTNCLIAVLNSRQRTRTSGSYNSGTGLATASNHRSTLRLGDVESLRAQQQPQIKVQVLQELESDYIELDDVQDGNDGRKSAHAV
ncbi:hypothetical protein BDP27DRAFT_1426761 [Rhodocollybia butyracea]|uniref:DUF6534 domain-containing protein n=1 Tax=Rhodocollybia butyracea TaxID=206335 RepID=A0A9P5PK89_9AGAR|nr:hypothetical protein BDP27DRAFT_1426761 [Rhodocollybia butyracea]